MLTSTGGATLLADACGMLGLSFPKPSNNTVQISSQWLPDFASRANPLDDFVRIEGQLQEES
jgi:acyl-CoA synthetase (NDP forming)